MCWYAPTILSCGCILEDERNMWKAQCEKEDARLGRLQIAVDKDEATGQGNGSAETIKAQQTRRNYCKIIIRADGDTEFVTKSSGVCEWHRVNPGIPKPPVIPNPEMPKPPVMPIAPPKEKKNEKLKKPVKS